MTTLAQVVVGFKQLLAQGQKDKTKSVKDLVVTCISQMEIYKVF